MAPRAYWKGFLRLSLVTCPIALFPATSQSEKISFNQINRNTGHRIKYQKIDADTGQEVSNEDIIKGTRSTPTDTLLRRGSGAASHQAFVAGFYRNDVLPACQHHSFRRNSVCSCHVCVLAFINLRACSDCKCLLSYVIHRTRDHSDGLLADSGNDEIALSAWSTLFTANSIAPDRLRDDCCTCPPLAHITSALSAPRPRT